MPDGVRPFVLVIGGEAVLRPFAKVRREYGAACRELAVAARDVDRQLVKVDGVS